MISKIECALFDPPIVSRLRVQIPTGWWSSSVATWSSMAPSLLKRTAGSSWRSLEIKKSLSGSVPIFFQSYFFTIVGLFPYQRPPENWSPDNWSMVPQPLSTWQQATWQLVDGPPTTFPWQQATWQLVTWQLDTWQQASWQLVPSNNWPPDNWPPDNLSPITLIWQLVPQTIFIRPCQSTGDNAYFKSATDSRP